MKEKFIVIGDTHGCLRPTLEVVDTCNKLYPTHKIIFLGDYLDRGLEVSELIQFISTLNAVFLLGNHEQMFFSNLNVLINNNFDQKTIVGFLSKYRIDDYCLNWLSNNLKIKHETAEYIFSHAGLNPKKSINDQNADDYLWSNSIDSYKLITKKIVVHGHTMVKNVSINDNNINIDTGCGKGGKLSALILPEMDIISSKSIGFDLESHCI